MRRGELPLARARFTRLLALNPPASVKAILQQEISGIDRQLWPRLAARSLCEEALTAPTSAGGTRPLAPVLTAGGGAAGMALAASWLLAGRDCR